MTKNVQVIYSRGFTEIQEQTQVLLKMPYCSLNYTAMLRAAVSYCPLSQSTAISKNLAVPSWKRIVATGFIDFFTLPHGGVEGSQEPHLISSHSLPPAICNSAFLTSDLGQGPRIYRLGPSKQQHGEAFKPAM